MKYVMDMSSCKGHGARMVSVGAESAQHVY